MRKVFTVAWREFRHTAMTKAFIFGALIMPILIMALFILVMPLMNESNKTPLTGEVALIAADDVLAEFEKQLDQGDTTIKVILEQIPVLLDDPISNAMLQANLDPKPQLTIIKAAISELVELKKQVQDGELAGLLVVPDSVISNGGATERVSVQGKDTKEDTVDPNPSNLKKDTKEKVELFIPSHFSPNHTKVLKGAISRSVIDVRIRRLGHQPEDIHSLTAIPVVKAIRLSEDGAEAPDYEGARRIIPMAFMILLWVATFTSGNYLLTTTIEEKGNKVMEVLLSALSPMQLLGGKILGQAGVSTVILAMYGSSVIAGLIALKMFDLIPVSHLVLMGVFFVMAYFMIATIMAAVGSAVSELRDAQSLMGPIMLILIIPLALWPVLSEHPNGMLATITSFTPPLIPFVMILRVTASTEPVALWQILLSIGIGFLSVLGMVWMCARIFRIGILMQGKPPNIIHLIRWIKQG